jgi:hypothetical protein
MASTSGECTSMVRSHTRLVSSMSAEAVISGQASKVIEVAQTMNEA